MKNGAPAAGGFIDAVSKIVKLDHFVGGVLSQQAHLNMMVDAINSIIDAATGDPQAFKALLQGMERRLTYATENGQVVVYVVPAQKLQDVLP